MSPGSSAEELSAQIAALRAELAATRAELAAERARNGHDVGPVPASMVPAPARPTPARPPRWRQSDSGAYLCHVGAALTRGEERLAQLPWPDGWLVATGFEVADHTRTREVDALVIAPGGVVVIEQKDTVARGQLELHVNGPATVDGREIASLTGALRQARLPAQMVSTALRTRDIRAGYVSAVLSIHGRATVRAEQIGGVHVCATARLVRTAASLVELRDPEEGLSAGAALGVLSAVGLPLTGLPALNQIGFHDSTW